MPNEERANPERQAERDNLVHEERGVFMISVAAELAGVHPQTLRVYEARGLIKPSRSPKQTRLYSRQDVQRLQHIQELTTVLGLNLAGVERVLALEEMMPSMRRQLEAVRREAQAMEHEMIEQIEAVHRSYKRELVRWQPPGEALRPSDATKAHRIPIERKRPSGSKEPDGFQAGSNEPHRFEAG
jgi:MerR family transcriptional regulator, heat shock protein HspR